MCQIKKMIVNLPFTPLKLQPKIYYDLVNILELDLLKDEFIAKCGK